MEPVLKQGFLYKRPHYTKGIKKSRVSTWKLRWFILRPSSLSYYKNELSQTPLGVVPLEGIKIEYDNDPHERLFQFFLQVPAATKSHAIATTTAKLRAEWFDAIMHCVETLNNNNGSSPRSQPKDQQQDNSSNDFVTKMRIRVIEAEVNVNSDDDLTNSSVTCVIQTNQHKLQTIPIYGTKTPIWNERFTIDMPMLTSDVFLFLYVDKTTFKPSAAVFDSSSSSSSSSDGGGPPSSPLILAETESWMGFAKLTITPPKDWANAPEEFLTRTHKWLELRENGSVAEVDRGADTITRRPDGSVVQHQRNYNRRMSRSSFFYSRPTVMGVSRSDYQRLDKITDLNHLAYVRQSLLNDIQVATGTRIVSSGNFASPGLTHHAIAANDQEAQQCNSSNGTSNSGGSDSSDILVINVNTPLVGKLHITIDYSFEKDGLQVAGYQEQPLPGATAAKSNRRTTSTDVLDYLQLQQERRALIFRRYDQELARLHRIAKNDEETLRNMELKRKEEEEQAKKKIEEQVEQAAKQKMTEMERQMQQQERMLKQQMQKKLDEENNLAALTEQQLQIETILNFKKQRQERLKQLEDKMRNQEEVMKQELEERLRQEAEEKRIRIEEAIRREEEEQLRLLERRLQREEEAKLKLIERELMALEREKQEKKEFLEMQELHKKKLLQQLQKEEERRLKKLEADIQKEELAMLMRLEQKLKEEEQKRLATLEAQLRKIEEENRAKLQASLREAAVTATAAYNAPAGLHTSSVINLTRPTTTTSDNDNYNYNNSDQQHTPQRQVPVKAAPAPPPPPPPPLPQAPKSPTATNTTTTATTKDGQDTQQTLVVPMVTPDSSLSAIIAARAMLKKVPDHPDDPKNAKKRLQAAVTANSMLSRLMNRRRAMSTQHDDDDDSSATDSDEENEMTTDAANPILGMLAKKIAALKKKTEELDEELQWEQELSGWE